MYELYAQGATLKEIGARFDLTRERVRQILQSAGFSTRSTSQTIAMQRASQVEERHEEICAAFLEYRDMSEVARQLNVSHKVVKKVVESHLPVSEYRRRKAMPQRYSDDELTAFLREASTTSAKVVTMKVYTEYAEGKKTADGRAWPTHQTFAKRFGSWRGALQAAGLKANRPAPMTGNLRYGEAECVEAIHAAARALGKVPTAAEYFTFAKDSEGAFPSQATIRNHCGTWFEALAKAGM